MESSGSVLVLVAHPNEETIGFSSVCIGADVVTVTDGSWGGHAATRRHAFTQACEILGARRAQLLDLPDISPWSLPIDILIDRLRAEVLAQACQEWPPESILDLGACEGQMTLRLRQLFPAAKILAVESHPLFVSRLVELLAQERNVDVIQASIHDIPLSADFIVMAEMLCYVPEPIMRVLNRLRANYLLTSYHGTFDACLRQSLEAFGWRETSGAEILPRFEPVDGRDSLLMAWRPGSHLRLWRPS